MDFLQLTDFGYQRRQFPVSRIYTASNPFVIPCITTQDQILRVYQYRELIKAHHANAARISVCIKAKINVTLQKLHRVKVPSATNSNCSEIKYRDKNPRQKNSSTKGTINAISSIRTTTNST